MRKYLLLIILLSLTLLFCSCSHVQSHDISSKTASVNGQIIKNKGDIEEKVNENNKDIWKGKWNRINTDIYNPSSIDITEVKDSGFTFNIEAESGANIGSVDGSAVFNENSNAVYESDDGFKVQFSISNNILKVKILSGNESDYAASGVTFKGIYKKDKLDEPSLVSQGIFGSEEQETIFKKLVGNEYDNFLYSFMKISELDDLDGFGAKVRSGTVKGFSGAIEAIIMVNSKNLFWAAYIDDDGKIRYFTNDIKSKTLPKTIDKWRESFKDKKVIFEK
jgi:hypothetical protein